VSGLHHRVLVTGGRGFIGRRCLPRLAALGHEVHAVSSAAPPPGAGETWHRCDLLDPEAAKALLGALRPTHLLHLAWIATPGLFWTSELNGRWLAAGRRLAADFYAGGGRRMVVAGTCAEYARSDAPCAEDSTPIAPNTPYGQAKAAMHEALREAAKGRGGHAWARLFFPYGPGEPPGRFIPGAIDALLRGEPFACTHGRQLRDFIYADDVAEALVALLGGECDGAYNIGAGEGRSLRQVADAIVAELGRAELLRFGALEAPLHEYASVVADTVKIGRDLGWRPRTGLQEGIRLTVAARRRAGGD
jgi:nucleoside-diphosphate-sugar epimerase